MAEISTGVLHNIGNSLNSVTTTAHVLLEGLTNLKVASLKRCTQLLEEHADDLPSFFASRKGQLFPSYLNSVVDEIDVARDRSLDDLVRMGESIEHIQAAVATQQTYARGGGTVNRHAMSELLDHAVNICSATRAWKETELERDYIPATELVVDKNRVIQILVNCVSNARQAMDEVDRPPHLIMRILQGKDHTLCVEIQDNGPGVAPENLSRLFEHGFTTKRDGHGFGLHSSANHAMEMGGELIGFNNPNGEGAIFCLTLPLSPPEQPH